MQRVFSLCAITFGLITLVVVGMLAYARRNDPADWIIFSVQAGNYNSGKVDIYRVLADGTHTAKLISSFDGYPNLWWIPPNPGWLVLYDSDLGGQRLQLVHLMGHTKWVMNEPSTMWPSIYYFDRQHQRVYLTITNDPANNRTIWVMDLHTGERTPYELPLKLNYLRYQLGDEGYVYWSDHASAGDLYAMRFANLPHITPLTIGGQVIRDGPYIRYNEWMYYCADDGNPDAYVHLYRIRDDGSDAQLVAEQVLILEDTISLGGDATDRIYYWGGDPQQPHLIRANPDGSQPTDLPITPIVGFGMGWSPDRQWFYYATVTDPESSSVTPPNPLLGIPSVGHLRRVNMATGEDALVWSGGRPYTIQWSSDGQTLLVVAEREGGNNYQQLFRMRPDGSDPTLLVDNLRSSSMTQLADVDVVVLGTWGKVGGELHMLDLETLEIRPLPEAAPPRLMRQVLATLPMPESDWQVGGLVMVSVILLGVGAAARQFPPIRPRR